MAGDTAITVVGNLTADPEIRYTQSGVAVASFTIASTPRSFDRSTGEWKDGEALFLRGTVWRDYAEHVSKSLTKGMRVIATGNLRQRSYETREGEKRTSYEIDIDEIGPSLRYATAAVTRVSSATGGARGGFAGGAPQAAVANPSAPSADVWSSPAAAPAPSAGSRDVWTVPGAGADDTPF